MRERRGQVIGVTGLIALTDPPEFIGDVRDACSQRGFDIRAESRRIEIAQETMQLERFRL